MPPPAPLQFSSEFSLRTFARGCFADESNALNKVQNYKFSAKFMFFALCTLGIASLVRYCTTNADEKRLKVEDFKIAAQEIVDQKNSVGSTVGNRTLNVGQYKVTEFLENGNCYTVITDTTTNKSVCSTKPRNVDDIIKTAESVLDIDGNAGHFNASMYADGETTEFLENGNCYTVITDTTTNKSVCSTRPRNVDDNIKTAESVLDFDGNAGHVNASMYADGETTEKDSYHDGVVGTTEEDSYHDGMVRGSEDDAAYGVYCDNNERNFNEGSHISNSYYERIDGNSRRNSYEGADGADSDNSSYAVTEPKSERSKFNKIGSYFEEEEAYRENCRLFEMRAIGASMRETDSLMSRQLTAPGSKYKGMTVYRGDTRSPEELREKYGGLGSKVPSSDIYQITVFGFDGENVKLDEKVNFSRNYVCTSTDVEHAKNFTEEGSYLYEIDTCELYGTVMQELAQAPEFEEFRSKLVDKKRLEKQANQENEVLIRHGIPVGYGHIKQVWRVVDSHKTLEKVEFDDEFMLWGE